MASIKSSSCRASRIIAARTRDNSLFIITMYSLSEAALKLGKSKSTLSKMLKEGVLSYTVSGNRKPIDAYELARVFPEISLVERSFSDNSNTIERLESYAKTPEINCPRK